MIDLVVILLTLTVPLNGGPDKKAEAKPQTQVVVVGSVGK